MPAQDQRLTRLRNRIRRTQRRLSACKSAKAKRSRKSSLHDIVRTCDGSNVDFEELVDRVTDWLDSKIEPTDPLLEWLSDVGIDIAAHAAVAIYMGTERRLKRRFKRDMATFKRLGGDLEQLGAKL